MPPRDAGNVDAEEKTLKNKPKASKLRQQKLPAWQPILTASTVIPTIFCVGIIFIPVGIALYLAADSVIETKLDYTDCTEFANGICNIDFTVSKDMEGDVFAYYYLENYYQNHRRYVKSRNDEQYLGNVDKVTDCAPFDYAEDPLTKKKLPIAPCGAVANSMFNDTFSLTYTDPRSGLPVAVPFTSNGVLWDVDIQKKFKNPTSPDGNLCTAFKDTIRPPNWSKNPCENGGFENVDFIVWMRTAALPNFRKLWRLVDRSSNNDLFRRGLPKGNYKLTVTNNYPVKQFEGRKGFLLSTSSWAGGRNSFLGIAYLVVGCLAIALGVIFIVIHIKFGHSLHDMTSVPPAHQ